MADDELATIKPPGELAQPRRGKSALAASILAASVALTLGVAAAPAYGPWVFTLLPTTVGFAAAAAAYPKGTAKVAGILTGVFAALLLLTTGLEGLICVLMALPLVLPGLALGLLTGALVRRRVPQSPALRALIVLVSVVALAGARAVETEPPTRTLAVTTEAVLYARPGEVWDAITVVPELRASKPFLMHIGLPVPLRCEMTGEGVGARRTCFFEQGRIEERVTAWVPGRELGLDIVAHDLPGRAWLGFVSARYTLRETADGTAITRTTVVSSTLGPQWYWERPEALGVHTEHEYLFATLVDRFGGRMR